MGLGLKSFEDTFNFVKKNPKVFLLALLLNLVVIPVADLVELTTLSLEWIILLLIYFVLIIFLSILVGGTYPFLVFQGLRRKEVDLKEALKSSLKRFWDMVILFILLGLITLGILAIPFSFLILSLFFNSTTYLLISIILFIPFLVVFVFVSLRLYLALPILLLESKKPVESVRNSWKRTKGHLCSIFVAALLLGLFMIIITLPLNILASAVKYFGLYYLSTSLEIISSTINTTFSNSLISIVYFNLKKKAYEK